MASFLGSLIDGHLAGLGCFFWKYGCSHILPFFRLIGFSRKFVHVLLPFVKVFICELQKFLEDTATK